MTATTTIPAREVRGGDIVVTDTRRHPIADIRVRGDLCVLIGPGGAGELVHADAELRVACADVAPFKPNGKDRSDA